MDGAASSDAEQIRAKRIARLQGVQQVPASSQTPPSVYSNSGEEKETGSTNYPTPIQASSPTQLSSLKRASSTSFPDTSTKLRAPSATVLTARAIPSSNSLLPLEDWEDKVLTQIFQATVDPSRASANVEYLESARDDLLEQGESVSTRSVKMCLSILDQVILTLASSKRHSTPFTYILQCYKRASDALSKVHRVSKPTGDYQTGVLLEVRRICVSYCEFCITSPDMFGGVGVSLRKELARDSDDAAYVPQELLQDLSLRVQDDDGLASAFIAAIESLSESVQELDLLDDYKPYLNALSRLASIKIMASLMTTSAIFLLEDCPAHEIETLTLLGPFFRLSPLQSKVVKAYFPNPKSQTRSALESSASALRMMLRAHQDQLNLIVNAIIRSSVNARHRILDYFAFVLNANEKRRALQVEENAVSTDGFLLNINAILNRLCEPFMDATYSKIDKIDVSYFKQHPRLKIRSDTKLNSDQSTSDQYYDQEVSSKSNFNSEVFFLNTAAYHLGYVASMLNAKNLARDVADMEKHLERLQKEREKYLNSPQLAHLDRNLKILQDRIQTGHSYEAALSSILSDEITQMQILSFMNYITIWLLRLISPNQLFPAKQLSLPLPATAPEDFSNLPEYFVEDVTILFRDVLRNYPMRITAQQAEGMTIFAITFLRMSNYIKNPYLKAKFAEVLYFGITPNRSNSRGVLGDILNGLKFSSEYLMHSLMSFYIEVEQTGAHTQFYDKFNIRYHISQVVKAIWQNPNYREKLAQESSGNVQFFIRFVALLLNDVTFLLDESLSKLAEIHRLQHELAQPDLTATSVPSRAEQERLLASSENSAMSYVGLANETVHMVRLFTAAIPDAFVTQEIVHRLAGMLNYNLDALVGPKCNNLKVENPQKYRFEPKKLLSEMTCVYLNLGTRPAFIEAIAKDGRSYKPANFDRAQHILKKYVLQSDQELSRLDELANLVEIAKKLDDEGEEELGDDIPDDFLDPLMATLMEEPVILPSSKARVDLSTIKSYLLSDSRDPFNRDPLKIEDVVVDHVLKQRIQEFRMERREAKRSQFMDVDP